MTEKSLLIQIKYYGQYVRTSSTVSQKCCKSKRNRLLGARFRRPVLFNRLPQISSTHRFTENLFNGAETNCGIAHILGILLKNSYDIQILLEATFIYSLSPLNRLIRRYCIFN